MELKEENKGEKTLTRSYILKRLIQLTNFARLTKQSREYK